MARKFRASVQYNDFRGTAAADRGDNNDLLSHFRDQGYVSEKDVLVAIEFWSGENHSGPVKEMSVTLTVADIQNHTTLDDFLADPKRPSLRSVHVDMTNDEFFGFFKRFNVVLTHSRYEDQIGANEYEADDIYPNDS
ncbi:hypothetical protein [Hoeflea ulvae]|uniref:Uncharacterized protein n=1 Tax=Hoeflea ulvae TaxID=2983764 RepID=A0ABT3YFG5_9HYPH|nr:hypothetical protein [Hoeflea ulvae]MCY0094596.1 hypothetical protein [Hoeflea ulvae]